MRRVKGKEKVVAEIVVGREVREEKVVDEEMTRDDAEEMDETLDGGSEERGESCAGRGGGREYGEVDVGVGVGGVEEAGERERGRGRGRGPEREDAVDGEEVGEEGGVFVPAVGGAGRDEGGDEGWERRVD